MADAERIVALLACAEAGRIGDRILAVNLRGVFLACAEAITTYR